MRRHTRDSRRAARAREPQRDARDRGGGGEQQRAADRLRAARAAEDRRIVEAACVVLTLTLLFFGGGNGGELWNEDGWPAGLGGRAGLRRSALVLIPFADKHAIQKRRHAHHHNTPSSPTPIRARSPRVLHHHERGRRHQERQRLGQRELQREDERPERAPPAGEVLVGEADLFVCHT